MKTLRCEMCGWEGNDYELNAGKHVYVDENTMEYKLVCPRCGEDDYFRAKIDPKDLRGLFVSFGHE